MKMNFKKILCSVTAAVMCLSQAAFTVDAQETTTDYDFLVDASVEADDPENHIYKTIQAAYDAASAGTEDDPTVIALMPDVYDLAADDTDADARKDQVGLGIYKDYITLIGLSDSADDVVIADNRGLNAGASSNYYSSTVASNCTGLTMKNITVLNYCNLNYTYTADTSKNLTKRTSTETQAFAYFGDGDKHYYYNCKFVSLLDTSYNGAKRSLYDNCYVQGTNDFIMGGTTQVYYNCTIKALANHIIGGGIENAVFINTTFLEEKDGSSATNFCKGETPITLINCTIPSTGTTMSWMPTLPSQYKFYYYNLLYDNGEPGYINGNESCAIELTEEQAQAYNLWNLLKGDDEWDPVGARAEYEALGDLPYRVTVSPSSDSVTTNEGSVTFTATVTPSAASEIVEWSCEGDIEIAADGNTVTVTGTNTSKENTTATVKATISNGLYEIGTITVVPETEQPPEFTREPSINPIENQVISLDYELDLGERTDTSLITWYRCDDAQGTNALVVADTKYDVPCTEYTLSRGDVGKYIMVTIAPKNELSDEGELTTLFTSEPIGEDEILTDNVYTDFLHVPTHPPFITEEELTAVDDEGVAYRNYLLDSIPDTQPGKWNFIGNWYYNYGVGDASEIMGIITGTRYCRLIYPQEGQFGNMKLTFEIYPEKTNNTGFGGIGQYEDVLIKYDPDTQTGYGVRYERTADDAKSSFVTLYKYENGEATAISETVQTTALRAKCTLVLSYIDGVLSVHMESTKNTDSVVDLTAELEDNGFGGVSVYHTGTVSAGGRMVFKTAEILYGEDAQNNDEDYILGDVDLSGTIEAADAALALQYTLNQDTAGLSTTQIVAADVNCDGNVDASDAAAILQKTLNAEYEF